MTATVVTLSVQLGSGGFEIAQSISRKLGYRYYDREITAQAASLVGVSAETVIAAERWPSFIERMLERLALASASAEGVLPGTPATNPAALTMTSADYRRIIEEVVVELAKRGSCVIVGHAAQVVLRDQELVSFNVLVHGSAARRAERLAQERDLPVKEALKEVEESDADRSNLFRHAYGVDLLDSSLYDLTLNTDDLDLDAAAALVLAGVEASS